jgi:hypothetical protein
MNITVFRVVTACESEMPENNFHNPRLENLDFHSRLAVRVACVFCLLP